MAHAAAKLAFGEDSLPPPPLVLFQTSGMVLLGGCRSMVLEVKEVGSPVVLLLPATCACPSGGLLGGLLLGQVNPGPLRAFVA
mmetsp:Transcript_61695/g.139661  ORF Transcript_61695/g.139661 Transcript_61695/m.139661 type:complete len:83 (+) Transcript_61695:257-505(+)